MRGKHVLLTGSLVRSAAVLASATMILTGALPGAGVRAATPVKVKDALLAVPVVESFAVDSAHRHMFFTSGDYAKGILVTDLSGKKVKTLAIGVSIDQVTVASGGKYAYAVSAAHGRIYQIGLAKLAVVRSFKLPGAECPVSFAA